MGIRDQDLLWFLTFEKRVMNLDKDSITTILQMQTLFTNFQEECLIAEVEEKKIKQSTQKLWRFEDNVFLP
jgi:hypothetical protein